MDDHDKLKKRQKQARDHSRSTRRSSLAHTTLRLINTLLIRLGSFFSSPFHKAGSGEKRGEHDLEEVYSPIVGHTVALEETGYKVFSSHILGEGVGIIPDKSYSGVYSPVSGTIKTAPDTGHAYGIETKSGVEILLHIGVGTVKMKGKGFRKHVSAGDHVHVGDKLADVDYRAIKKARYSNVTIMTVTNSRKMEEVIAWEDINVDVGTPIIEVTH